MKHLNEGSLLILKDLNPENFDEVRFSSVVELNVMDITPFKLAVKGITKGMKQSKRSQLEGAVAVANKYEKLITRENFNKVIDYLRKSEIDNKENTELRNLL